MEYMEYMGYMGYAEGKGVKGVYPGQGGIWGIYPPGGYTGYMGAGSASQYCGASLSHFRRGEKKLGRRGAAGGIEGGENFT